MKATTLGIILIIVGFLIVLYGFGRSAFDFITPTIGIAKNSGSIYAVADFRFD